MKKIIPVALLIIALIIIGGYYMDRKEGGVAESDTMMVNDVQKTDVELATAKMVGTWQSTEDDKAIVTFNEDGTTIDTYDGEQMGTGSWMLSAKEDYEGSGLHLTTVVNEETYDYAVWSVDDTQLTMNYLSRGNTLNYVRVVDAMTDTSN